MIGRIHWFRYVRHAAIADYESKGWVVVAALGPTHGGWSCLMRLSVFN